MKYKEKAVEIEAITFDEFVQYGCENGANIVNGIPWSFKYNGQAVTNETDDWYLIQGELQIHHFKRGDMLIISHGEARPMNINSFNQKYTQIFPDLFEGCNFQELFMNAALDLGRIAEALGLHPDDAGADPALKIIESMKARLKTCEALAKDAGRYRWLRDDRNWSEDGITPIVGNGEDTIYGETLDNAIDKAIAGALV